jgi:Skp family chaperone for outer membrane proteins
MKSRKSLASTILSLVVPISLVGAPALAQRSSANPVSLKIGYFNLVLIKSAFPQASESEALRIQAENQLKQDLDTANKQIQKMQDEKKSSEDIQKAVHENQVVINAKQEALVRLLQTQNAMARDRIIQAVNQVAQEKGLDIIFDGEGLYAGGKTVLDNGMDVTDEIKRKLQPSEGVAAPARKPAK